MFIKLTLVVDGNETPTIIDTDVIERFDIEGQKIKLIYKERDQDGYEFFIEIKNTIEQLEQKLKIANLLH